MPRMTFRVCCAHCHDEILTGMEMLNEEQSQLLAAHLETNHPAIGRPANVALGDLLQHFEFQAETDE
jgi:hypothetical protein